MHALACQGVEEGGQNCHQGLALPGAHLRYVPLMESHASDELHSKVPQAQDSGGGLTNHREGLGKQAVQILAALRLLLQLRRQVPELIITLCLEGLLESVDLRDPRGVPRPRLLLWSLVEGIELLHISEKTAPRQLTAPRAAWTPSCPYLQRAQPHASTNKRWAEDLPQGRSPVRRCGARPPTCRSGCNRGYHGALGTPGC
mmetsp:Transcript_41409/g.129046  ORF Transcript_41409/g.129046 Transcript_41409/m.129046 type:complete len:201 (+) Transcript_41409:1967-2569(+)